MSEVVAELVSGKTRLRIVTGKSLDHLTQGLYTGANARGVMGAGLPAEIRRIAGQDIERDLRAQGPLSPGIAYLTAPGMLAERGVKAIAHGVVVAEPGANSSLKVSIDALLSGLRLLEDSGCRSVTIPQIGWRVSDMDQRVVAAELGRVIATHLRRRSRLDLVTIVSADREYLRSLANSLRTSGAEEHEPGAGVEV